MDRHRTVRLGGRVTAAAPSGCGCCGHPFTLHSNGRTPCKAAACTAGPDGQPCTGFTSEHQAQELLAS